MMPKDPHVAGRCSEIEELVTKAAGWAARDEKLGAHLAAYLTVLITGVLEDCIEHLVVQRAGKAGDEEMQNLVQEYVNRRFGNPDHGAISGLLGQFSPEYKNAFTSRFPHNGSNAAALKSVIDNKNNLAHEGASKLEMTVGDVDNYYRRIVPILEALEAILLPTVV